MSLKDDFLEALRSVKRDFFRDYEYQEPAIEEIPPAPAPPSFTEQPTEPVYSARTPQPSPDTEPVVAQDVHIDPPPPVVDDTSSSSVPVQPEIMDEPEWYEKSASASDFDAEHFEYDNTNSDDYSSDESPLYPMEGRIFFDGDNFDTNMEDDQRTVISKNTVIRGALQTEDSIRMYGQVLGDIDCKSNILMAGKVRGNTSAANAYIMDAQVDGNMLCDDVINVTDDAWVLGNIRAQQAQINGKIKGNIEIRNTISIGAHSSIIGNISTDELEIKRGAFVNGQIIMYSPSRDVIDRFEQFDR